MTSEDGGFDAGDFYEEGIKEAGLDQDEAVTDSPSEQEDAGVASQVSDDGTAEPGQKPETKPADTKTAEKQPSAEEVKAALESTEEPEAEAESVIESLLPKPQAAEQKPDVLKQGKYVPVDDHIRLRQRAQAAESKVEELQKQLETSTTPTGGEKPGEEVEKSPLKKFVEENPDEDFVPAKVQLEEREFHEERQRKAQAAKERAEQAEREKQEKQRQQAEAIESLSSRAKSSEVEFRKATPDYDAVTKPIVNGGFLTDADRLEFLKSENPAKRLYEICQVKSDAIRGVLGKTDTSTPKEETTKEKAPANKGTQAAGEEQELSDDEIYEEVKDLLPANEDEED
jgi:hypothetical protein